MRFVLKITLLSCLSWFCSCEKEVFSVGPAEEESVVTAEAVPAAGAELLDRVNQLRRAGCRCGSRQMPPVGALKWSSDLELAAQRHALDMEANSFFSHLGSDGSDISDRIGDTGYRWQAVGENIAWGYTSAAAVFQGWKDSPGHCRNMMHPDFTHMGSAREGRYWVQDFARPQAN